MDRDEQANDMLNRPPEDWSEGARKLHLPLDKLPEHVRSAVAARVAKAKAQNQTQARPALVWKKIAYAAAAMCLLSMGSYIALPGLFTPKSPSTDPAFVRGRGDFTLKRDGRKTSLTADTSLVPGDEIILKKNADVLLQRDKLSFHLSGPTVLQVRPGGLKHTVLFLDRGALAVRTLPSKDPQAGGHPLTGHPGLHILTRRARYTLAGTFARIVVSQAGERIAVLKGLFRVRGTLAADAIAVGAGKALSVPADPGEKIPPAGLLSAGDREALQWARESIQALREGHIVINEAVSFSTEDEILKYYGGLHRIELKDGQSYTGFALRKDENQRIHTLLGVIDIPSADVRAVKKLKGKSP